FLLFNFSWFLVMTANLAVVSQTISIINSFSDVAFPSWIFVAIGGITAEDIPGIMQTGISGIALSGAILRAENPIEEINRILKYE
ncbi:MAG: thiamine phosphate synthase, partial [Bacteroidaceae bacterium]|nr:thiamine phosphate synthase [Bacteroidaceae bacterium]